MDTLDATTLIVIVAAALACVAVAAVVVRRARRRSIVRVAPGGPPGPSPAARRAPQEAARMAAEGQLVEIQHPLVLRSAEQALAKGAPMARFIVEHDGKLWLTFEPLADPAERERAYALFRQFNAGGDIDVRQMVEVIGKMSR